MEIEHVQITQIPKWYKNSVLFSTDEGPVSFVFDFDKKTHEVSNFEAVDDLGESIKGDAEAMLKEYAAIMTLY